MACLMWFAILHNLLGLDLDVASYVHRPCFGTIRGLALMAQHDYQY
jgi:hypothetical protein